MRLEATLSWFKRKSLNQKNMKYLLKVEACGVCHGDAIVKYGGIILVYNIHERLVMRLLVQLQSWVRNRITGRLGKGSGLVGVEGTVFGADRA